MPRREQIDIRRLRYVLYARKSTEDENRQIRSTDDQIKDCLKLAAEQGLHVVGDPIVEHKSAKRPGQRRLFTKMLEDIEAGKYDAILCWHPDRLCRNMLEGGKVINMLDEGVLRDIRLIEASLITSMKVNQPEHPSSDTIVMKLRVIMSRTNILKLYGKHGANG